jgi:hypothetical protein
MEDVGIFYGHLEYFLPRFGILRQEKSAALIVFRHLLLGDRSYGS